MCIICTAAHLPTSCSASNLSKTNLSVPFSFWLFLAFFFVIPNLMTYHIGDTVRDRVRMATSSTCHDSFLHMQLFHKIILVFYFILMFSRSPIKTVTERIRHTSKRTWCKACISSSVQFSGMVSGRLVSPSCND